MARNVSERRNTLALTSLLAAVALVIAPVPARAQRVERDIAYGADSLQRLDLTTPSAPGFRTVIFIHGGSLRTGDKRDADYGKVCEPFAAAGFACANVNYRLGAAHRWPAQPEDVAAAVAWVRRHIAERGGDLAKIFLLGHSSGARLVALVGSDPHYLAAVGMKPGDLAGVIAMGSIMWDVGLEDAIVKYGRGRVDSAFAKDQDSEIFASLDVYLASWPIKYVHPGLPPMLFLIAAGEQEHPPVLATDRKFVEKARLAGDSARLVVLPGRTHYTAIRRLQEPGDPVFAIIREFVLHPGAAH